MSAATLEKVDTLRGQKHNPPFSSREFRDALGHAPSGVAIVTAVTGDGRKLGMTVSSFTALSLDPPLVLFSIARHAHSFPDWVQASRYNINVLGETQGELSTRFARALSDKWGGVDHRLGTGGVPIIAGAVAWFECAVHAICDGGDHAILIGRVTGWGIDPGNARPLLFHRGKYRKLDSDPAVGRPPMDSEFFGW